MQLAGRGRWQVQYAAYVLRMVDRQLSTLLAVRCLQ